MLDVAVAELAERRDRYQSVVERGAEALSRYDREIAYGGNDELARASSLALPYNNIAWLSGRVLGLQRVLGQRTQGRE